MFNFKKFGSVALSLAAIGLLLPAGASAATIGQVQGEIGGTGERDTGTGEGTFKPNEGDTGWTSTDFDRPVNENNVELQYTIRGGLNQFDNYIIDVEIPTSMSFVMLTSHADDNGVIVADSREAGTLLRPIGTITNNSYGQVDRGEEGLVVKPIDTVVEVISYDLSSDRTIPAGFGLEIFTDYNMPIQLVEAAAPGSGLVNKYLGETPPPAILASVVGVTEENGVGESFDLHYKATATLGDKDEDGTISNVLSSTVGNGNLTEAGTLGLRYSFAPGF